MRSRGWAWLLPFLAAGCGASFQNFFAPVPDEPTEVELADHLRGPLQRPSAFDMFLARPVRVDQTDSWDFLFLVTPEGEPQLRPVAVVTGELSDAGLQKVSESFEMLLEAPEEGYVTSSPTVIAEGDVLAVVSRRDPALQGLRCRRFGKLEILEIDEAGGILRLRHLINPNCEGRGLVPGETGVRG
ncbi:MAG: hypothetical protein ACE5HP_08320 [Gemmatimonadota bacterium]